MCDYNVILNGGNGMSMSFKLEGSEYKNRMDKNFWVGFLREEMKATATKLKDLFDDTSVMYFDYELRSSTRTMNSLTEMYSQMLTGFGSKMYETKTEAGEYYGGELSNLFVSEFEFRNLKSYQIAELFFYNERITGDEMLSDLRDGNSKKTKSLSKTQAQLLESYNWDNTNIDVGDTSAYNQDFENVHKLTKEMDFGEARYMSVSGEATIITKVPAQYPKRELLADKYGILMQKEFSKDFVYYESNVSNFSLCLVVVGDNQYAGTVIYADALKMGVSSELLRRALPPKYELLDQLNKNKCKVRLMRHL